MKDRFQKQRIQIITAFIVIAMGIVFFFLIFRADVLRKTVRSLIRILMPFVIGMVIAYILRPMCNFWEAKYKSAFAGISEKRRSGLAMGASIATSFLIVALIGYLLISAMIPQLARSIRMLITMLPRFTNRLMLLLNRILADHNELNDLLGTSISEMEKMLRGWLQERVLPSMSKVMGNVSIGIRSMVRILGNLFVGTIASVYILIQRRKLMAQGRLIIYSILPTRWAGWLIRELHYADRMFDGFLIGKILDSAIVGVLCFIGCTILRIPDALLVSVVVGVTNIIPFFGPYIGMVPSSLIVLLTSPIKAVVVLLFIILLQQLDGNVIGPHIIGDKTRLSGLWVLFSILFFGGLFGFVGMLIGVPLFAVIYDVLKQAVGIGLRHNGREDLAEEYRRIYHGDAAAPEETAEKTKARG